MMLQTIGQQQDFLIAYKELPDSEIDVTMKQCSVHLGREPVIICIGQGQTPFLAQVNAARSALVHLKMILPEIQSRR